MTRSKLMRAMKKTAAACAFALLGILVSLIGIAVWYLESRPDLKVWHTSTLDREFTADRLTDRDTPVDSFRAYLALEDALFDQLTNQVIDRGEAKSDISRFRRGSLASPDRWSQNWNRSFELAASSPKAGVLLLHGMSDSPYSVRKLAQQMNELGAWTLALRIPGHGTAPSALTRTSWQDMAAAVTLAAAHLSEKVGSAPFYIFGYSNGGALAKEYTLRSLDNGQLRTPDGVVLVSAQLGLTPLARLAGWQEKLGHLFGLKKFAWNSLLPEYDAFKYGSFALNAAIQAFEITSHNQLEIQRRWANSTLSEMPPILAFQSAVDATVSAPAVIHELLAYLEPGGHHEAVLFDINRQTSIESILTEDPRIWMEPLMDQGDQPYALTLITNAHDRTTEAVSRHRPEGQPENPACPLNLSWPEGVYSLSHLSLAFDADDPLYGSGIAPSPGLQLGNLTLRGERNILRVSAADILRQRWNPFYDYLSRRIFVFMGLIDPSAGICDPSQYD